ncbi:MAG: outer membrane beta-barrel protein [Bacteroidota bacterium]
MKKILWILSATLLGITTNAQKAGIDFSNNYFISTLNYDKTSIPGWGFGAGVAVPFFAGKKLSIRPELNYQLRIYNSKSSSHAEDNYSITESEYQSTDKYHFLELPLIFLVKPQKHFGFLFGIQFGKAVKSGYSYENTFTTTNKSNGQVSTSKNSNSGEFDDLNLSELSLNAGISFHLGNGFAFEVRGQRSLVLFVDGETDTEISWGTVQLGIRYELRKKIKENSK